jgi:hypothetical protein
MNRKGPFIHGAGSNAAAALLDAADFTIGRLQWEYGK